MLRRLVLLSFLALAAPAVAHANLVLHDTDAWNGTSPTGASPWLEANFVDGPNHTVTLTLKAVNLSTNSGTPEDIKHWLFNLDSSIVPSTLNFALVSQTGSFTLPTIAHTTQNAQSTQANVHFDIDFAFASGNLSNRFTQGDSVTYTITDPSVTGFSSAAFAYTTFSNGSGPLPLYDSAQVRNTGSHGNDGADIAAVGIPEPASFSMLAVVATGLLARRRRSQ